MIDCPIVIPQNPVEDIDPEIGQQYKFEDSGVIFKFVEYSGSPGGNCENCAFFETNDFPCSSFCCDSDERADKKTVCAIVLKREIAEKSENSVESFGNLDDNNLRKCCKDLEELYKQRELLHCKIESLKDSVKEFTFTLKQVDEKIFSILGVGFDNYQGESPLFEGQE